jgi:hypothetical protein
MNLKPNNNKKCCYPINSKSGKVDPSQQVKEIDKVLIFQIKEIQSKIIF